MTPERPKSPGGKLGEASAREQALADRATVLRTAPTAVTTRLALTAEEGYLLSRLDKPMSVGDVLRVSGLSEATALRLLLNLVQKGALLLPSDAEPATREKETASVYGYFVFSPGELNEDVELDLERRKQILFLFHRLDELSHFRLLGVSPLASSAELRDAFHEKAKLFHPDTVFRKRLGRYLPKIEAIFHRLKLAIATLGDDESRRLYEREHHSTFTADEQSAIVQREINVIEEEKRARGRRERLMTSKGFSKLTKARELVADGDEALGKGDISAASEAYRRASELDPRLDEARAKLLEARRVGLSRRADLAFDEAEKASAEGNVTRAIELLRSAADIDAGNGRVHSALAAAILRVNGDAREARLHAQRAVDLGDRSGAAHLLLGETLLKCGLKKNARRELEIASERGEAARAKPLLKQC